MARSTCAPGRRATHLLAGAGAALAAAFAATATGAATAQAAVPFTAPFGYYAGAVPQSVAVGDFNGDGHPDVVSTDTVCTTPYHPTAGTGYSPSLPANCIGEPGKAWVRFGGPLGTFSSARGYQVGGTPGSVTVGDFNGHEGIAVANNDGTASVLLGDGWGNFSTVTTAYSGYTGAGDIAAGDFNGDGHTDIAVAQTSQIAVYFGDGHGGFSVPAKIALTGNVTAGDLYGTGRDELVVSGGNCASPGYAVTIVSGDGSSSCLPTDTVGPVAVGDMNGDGHADIVQLGWEGHVWLNDARGGFSAPASFTAGDLTGGIAAANIVLADFDGDGHLDVAAANRDGKRIDVALGDGHGGFAQPPGQQYTGPFTAVYTSGNPISGVAAADFLGNGRPDLAGLSTPSGSMGSYQYNGPAGVGILYNLEPPSWWPAWAAGAWPSVLAQWASNAWQSTLTPWNLAAWVPQPVLSAWSTVTETLGFAASARTPHHRHAAPAWLKRLGAHRPPKWLTPRTVSRWAAGAERRARRRHAAHRRR